MKTRELLFPVEWEHPVEALSIKAVIRGSDEWNIAVGRVHKSLPSAKVMKLERIQNQAVAVGKVRIFNGEAE